MKKLLRVLFLFCLIACKSNFEYRPPCEITVHNLRKLARNHSAAIDLLMPCMKLGYKNGDNTYTYTPSEHKEIKITLTRTGSTVLRTNDTEFFDYLKKELEKFSVIAADNKRYGSIEGELFKIEYGAFSNIHEVIFSRTN